MFRMDIKTKEILEESNLSKSQEVAEKRQRVYKAIIEDGSTCTNKSLAEAAGYKMEPYGTKEYFSGFNFINRMLRQGYIEKQKGRDNEDYFYVTNKEPVSCLKPVVVTEEKAKEEPISLREVRENFAKELAEYEPEIEDDAEEEPLYSGVLSLGQPGSRGHVEVKFVEKSRAEIVDIISNLNLEDIL